MNQLSRLKAEDDLRLIQIAAAGQSVEAYRKIVGDLEGDVGQVYVWSSPVKTLVIDPETGLDPQFDRNALRELKKKVGGKKKKAADVEDQG